MNVVIITKAVEMLRSHKLEAHQVVPLNALAEHGNNWMTLAALHKATGDNRVRVLRALQTLRARGFTERRQTGSHFTIEHRMTAAGRNLVARLNKIAAPAAGGAA